MKGYGQILRELRGTRSLEEVANAAGVTRSAICMYEAEARVPRDETKVALADFFGKTVQEIFFDSDCHVT